MGSLLRLEARLCWSSRGKVQAQTVPAKNLRALPEELHVDWHLPSLLQSSGHPGKMANLHKTCRVVSNLRLTEAAAERLV